MDADYHILYFRGLSPVFASSHFPKIDPFVTSMNLSSLNFKLARERRSGKSDDMVEVKRTPPSVLDS